MSEEYLQREVSEYEELGSCVSRLVVFVKNLNLQEKLDSDEEYRSKFFEELEKAVDLIIKYQGTYEFEVESLVDKGSSSAEEKNLLLGMAYSLATIKVGDYSRFKSVFEEQSLVNTTAVIVTLESMMRKISEKMRTAANVARAGINHEAGTDIILEVSALLANLEIKYRGILGDDSEDEGAENLLNLVNYIETHLEPIISNLDYDNEENDQNINELGRIFNINKGFKEFLENWDKQLPQTKEGIKKDLIQNTKALIQALADYLGKSVLIRFLPRE